MITLGDGVCMNMVKESALNASSKVKVDSGRKILCHTGILIVILGNQSCTGVSFVNGFFSPVFHQVHLSCPAPSVHMYTCVHSIHVMVYTFMYVCVYRHQFLLFIYCLVRLLLLVLLLLFCC